MVWEVWVEINQMLASLSSRGSQAHYMLFPFIIPTFVCPRHTSYFILGAHILNTLKLH